MRAIFMIPTKPPPTLKDSTKFSSNFVDFLSKCLVKNANQRASAAELLQHEFIKTAKRDSMLKTLIDEVIKVKGLREHELTENGKLKIRVIVANNNRQTFEKSFYFRPNFLSLKVQTNLILC
jgi:serine/threonine protein kinase